MFGKIVYDVTFSFAEEDCAFVEEVASHLQARNVKYYYYKEEHVKAWGKELSKHLSLIYNKKSRLCVVFISTFYEQKFWTKFELENAYKRAVRDSREYILPYKMDDTPLPEVLSAIRYLSKNEATAQVLADAICSKVDEHKLKDTFKHRLQESTKYHFSKPVNWVLLIIFITSVFWFSFRNQLTPIDRLTLRLYEASKINVHGCLCHDGSFSTSQGSGTCSGSSIAQRDKDSMMPTKTFDECRELARRISWIP